MKSKIILLIFFFIGINSNAQVSGVGINEDTPQQALHLGSQTGTIRVDGLNSTNNTFNGGGIDRTYPVYVDHNGDLTLKTEAYDNSDGDDAFTTAAINGTLTILAADVPNDGYETTEITSFVFTLTRPTIVEIKYSLSIEVFQDNLFTIIKDPYARNITNFFTLNTPVLLGTTRRYGASSKCYFNRNDAATNPAAAPDGATGYIYNSGTTYIPLPAGVHSLRFYGTACSGSANRPTFVRFAGGPDSIFIKLY